MKYQYEGIGVHGSPSKGAIDAVSEREALRLLAESGVLVFRLEAQEPKPSRFGRRITNQDLLLVLHELSALLKARVTIIDSIVSLADGYRQTAMGGQLDQIAAALNRGESLSASLEKTELRLPDYLLQLVKAGEMTGQLAESLADGVSQMEFESEIAGETRNALIYPSVLVTSGVLAIGVVFTFVVPRFANLLERGDDLPWLAGLVLRSGMFFNSYGWMFLLAILGVVAIAAIGLRRKSTRQWLVDRAAALPIAGSWLNESEAGRWTGLLGRLLGNGVAMMEALELANRGVRLSVARGRFAQVVRAVRSGVPLSAALKEQQALTAVAYHILKTGENSGQLPDMLVSLSRIYASGGRTRIKRALTLLEPLAILFIGGIIGVIILGIMLAITSTAEIPI